MQEHKRAAAAASKNRPGVNSSAGPFSAGSSRAGAARERERKAAAAAAESARILKEEQAKDADWRAAMMRQVQEVRTATWLFPAGNSDYWCGPDPCHAALQHQPCFCSRRCCCSYQAPQLDAPLSNAHALCPAGSLAPAPQHLRGALAAAGSLAGRQAHHFPGRALALPYTRLTGSFCAETARAAGTSAGPEAPADTRAGR